VVGAEFTLGEVAEFDGFDLETLRKLSQVSLGRSPLPGRSLVLSVSFLASRLAEVVPPERLRLHVPPGAQVMRATQRISGREVAEQVLKLAAAQSGEQDGALEQKLLGDPPDAELPMGELSWEIAELGVNLTPGGPRTFRVVARVGGEEAWRTVVRIKQEVYRDVLVALRSIRRNQVVQAGDLAGMRRNVAGLKLERFLTRPAEVIGQRAKRSIARNEWIERDMLVAVADVAEGGAVTLVYRTPALHFRAPGVAMVPARVGEFIPVRNLASGKIVYGVVQDDDTVKVN
jgi:flagella basal body P-ring formation protein FlgA